jgi:hypothetical protein
MRGVSCIPVIKIHMNGRTAVATMACNTVMYVLFICLLSTPSYRILKSNVALSSSAAIKSNCRTTRTEFTHTREKLWMNTHSSLAHGDRPTAPLFSRPRMLVSESASISRAADHGVCIHSRAGRAFCMRPCRA